MASVCQLHFEPLAIVIGEDGNAVMFRIKAGGDRCGCRAARCGNRSARGRLGRAVDLDGEKFPPGFEAALSRSDCHAESLGGQLAGELSAQEFSLLEVVADSVVEVDAASAVVSGATGG